MRQDVTFLIGESATELTPDTAPFISSVHLFIKSTKTDQRGAGYARTLHRTNDPDLCVVRALVRHFMNTAGAPDDWPVTAYYTEQSRIRRAQRTWLICSRWRERHWANPRTDWALTPYVSAAQLPFTPRARRIPPLCGLATGLLHTSYTAVLPRTSRTTSRRPWHERMSWCIERTWTTKL
jgi:hypothetical protein